MVPRFQGAVQGDAFKPAAGRHQTGQENLVGQCRVGIDGQEHIILVGGRINNITAKIRSILAVRMIFVQQRHVPVFSVCHCLVHGRLQRVLVQHDCGIGGVSHLGGIAVFNADGVLPEQQEPHQSHNDQYQNSDYGHQPLVKLLFVFHCRQSGN